MFGYFAQIEALGEALLDVDSLEELRTLIQ